MRCREGRRLRRVWWRAVRHPRLWVEPVRWTAAQSSWDAWTGHVERCRRCRDGGPSFVWPQEVQP